MKKFIIIFSIFLFTSFSINTITTRANPEPENFSQGFYSTTDLGLMEDIEYRVQNISLDYNCFMMIIDNNQTIMEIIRLEPNSIKYCIRPLKYGYSVIIYGNGKLKFS